MTHAPPENRKAGVWGPGLGNGSGLGSRPHSYSGIRLTRQAIFTVRPRGTRWAVAAISPQGESVKLGIFPHRRDALSAAAVMARACGASWLP
jgi:hypothetical protein